MILDLIANKIPADEGKAQTLSNFKLNTKFSGKKTVLLDELKEEFGDDVKLDKNFIYNKHSGLFTVVGWYGKDNNTKSFVCGVDENLTLVTSFDKYIYNVRYDVELGQQVYDQAILNKIVNWDVNDSGMMIFIVRNTSTTSETGFELSSLVIENPFIVYRDTGYKFRMIKSERLYLDKDKVSPIIYESSILGVSIDSKTNNYSIAYTNLDEVYQLNGWQIAFIHCWFNKSPDKPSEFLWQKTNRRFVLYNKVALKRFDNNFRLCVHHLEFSYATNKLHNMSLVYWADIPQSLDEDNPVPTIDCNFTVLSNGSISKSETSQLLTGVFTDDIISPSFPILRETEFFVSYGKFTSQDDYDGMARGVLGFSTVRNVDSDGKVTYTTSSIPMSNLTSNDKWYNINMLETDNLSGQKLLSFNGLIENKLFNGMFYRPVNTSGAYASNNLNIDSSSAIDGDNYTTFSIMRQNLLHHYFISFDTGDIYLYVQSYNYSDSYFLQPYNNLKLDLTAKRIILLNPRINNYNPVFQGTSYDNIITFNAISDSNITQTGYNNNSITYNTKLNREDLVVSPEVLQISTVSETNKSDDYCNINLTKYQQETMSLTYTLIHTGNFDDQSIYSDIIDLYKSETITSPNCAIKLLNIEYTDGTIMNVQFDKLKTTKPDATKTFYRTTVNNIDDLSLALACPLESELI